MLREDRVVSSLEIVEVGVQIDKSLVGEQSDRSLCLAPQEWRLQRE
jgi:hypothetical protein